MSKQEKKLKPQIEQYESINAQSMQLMKDFNEKRKSQNIFLHKFFLAVLIAISLIFSFFIFFFKSKIAEIKIITGNYSTKITDYSSSLESSASSYNSKLVNIASRSLNGLFRFALLFETTEEVDMVKRFIFEYLNEKKNNFLGGDKNFDFVREKNLFMLYQGQVDSDSIEEMIEKIQFRTNLVFVIKTTEGRRFGFYLRKAIIPDKRKEYFSKENDKDAFVFSFIHKNMFKFMGGRNSFKIEKVSKKKGGGYSGYRIVFGDEDVILYDNYLSEGGRIKFPFTSFDTTTVNSNAFTERQGQFPIDEIEVFTYPIDSRF